MSDVKGFVTFLHEQLALEFMRLGPVRPRIWRDIHGIEAGEQFERKIKNALKNSHILLVVLSRNWLDREFCRKELQWFSEAWSGLDSEEIKSRIVLVCKHHIEPGRRPDLLQGQEGYKFYSIENPKHVLAADSQFAPEREFFSRGRIRDDRYMDQLEALAVYLWRTAEEPPAPHPPAHAPLNGRTIYVAIPAGDMREAYGTIVAELQRRGYAVVPDSMKNLPLDLSLANVIDNSFRDAEASVHLLGDGSGGIPEGEEEPIVQLQLTRAAAKVAASEDSKPGKKGGFRRFIWAPKNLGDAGADRDPLDVLKKFDARIKTASTEDNETTTWVKGDLVHGDILAEFVSSLVKALENSTPPPEQIAQSGGVTASIPVNSQVYIYHWEQDRSYALSVAKALRERKLYPILPAIDDDPVKCQKLHRSYLMENDFVVLCWAKATDTWRRTASHELKDWQQLGRTKQFTRRGLVVGPPRDQFKSELEIVPPPPSEIDVVLDLIEKDPPSPEALGPLVPG
jgi:hypothetical protein